MKKARKLYSSPNGDRWYLIRDVSGEVFIRHEANIACVFRGMVSTDFRGS